MLFVPPLPHPEPRENFILFSPSNPGRSHATRAVFVAPRIIVQKFEMLCFTKRPMPRSVFSLQERLILEQ